MKIGFLQLDGKYPELALMKLLAWHKRHGDETIINPTVFDMVDRVYVSKIFTYTPDINHFYGADIVRGGSGFDLVTNLEYDIEHIYPDYDSFGVVDEAHGFLTRGCPRKCEFCIVAEKEGDRSVKVANLDEFWKGQKKIMLFDPNILACTDKFDLLDQLAQSKAKVEFTQGLDIRLITDKVIEAIKKINIGTFYFAWDNPKDNLKEKFQNFIDVYGKIPHQRLCVYVLSNFNSTFEEDRYRVETLKSLGFGPYLMVYDKKNSPKILRKYSRYVNRRHLFYSGVSWEEYDRRK